MKNVNKILKFVGIIIVLLLVITAILFIILNFEYIINDIQSNLEIYVLIGLLVYVVIKAFFGENIMFLILFLLGGSLMTLLLPPFLEPITAYLLSVLI